MDSGKRKHSSFWHFSNIDLVVASIALEPWENVTSIRLAYESPRLEHVSWKDWKPILKSAAKKKKLDADELAVGKTITRHDPSSIILNYLIFSHPD